MIPEYKLPHAYPLPEPHKAGQPSTAHRTLLAVADEVIAAKTEEVRVLEEALGESFSLIRELRAQVEAQGEQIKTQQEYADGLVERQTREYELERSLERRAS